MGYAKIFGNCKLSKSFDGFGGYSIPKPAPKPVYPPPPPKPVITTETVSIPYDFFIDSNDLNNIITQNISFDNLDFNNLTQTQKDKPVIKLCLQIFDYTKNYLKTNKIFDLSTTTTTEYNNFLKKIVKIILTDNNSIINLFRNKNIDKITKNNNQKIFLNYDLLLTIEKTNNKVTNIPKFEIDTTKKTPKFLFSFENITNDSLSKNITNFILHSLFKLRILQNRSDLDLDYNKVSNCNTDIIYAAKNIYCNLIYLVNNLLLLFITILKKNIVKIVSDADKNYIILDIDFNNNNLNIGNGDKNLYTISISLLNSYDEKQFLNTVKNIGK